MNTERNRRSIRLKGYDYSQSGMYFVTICAQDRECLFGAIIPNGAAPNKIALNDAGRMIEREWEKLISRFPYIVLREYIIMPNHFHGIFEIRSDENKATIGDIVGAFKSITTAGYIHGVNNDGWQPFCKRLWQRNYYEHIVRNEDEYCQIAEYIQNNPFNWENDRENTPCFNS
ncbi:hypothetical protein FACS1894216_17310 [Synergistales bacterium]|nr:hypothetical protein FACS1894216_17310 [Synergistales bacterium]